MDAPCLQYRAINSIYINGLAADQTLCTTMETTGTLHSLGSVDSSPAVPASGRVVLFCGPASAIFCFFGARGRRIPRYDRDNKAAVLHKADRLTDSLQVDQVNFKHFWSVGKLGLAPFGKLAQRYFHSTQVEGRYAALPSA
jgi:hypothetical protein